MQKKIFDCFRRNTTLTKNNKQTVFREKLIELVNYAIPERLPREFGPHTTYMAQMYYKCMNKLQTLLYPYSRYTNHRDMINGTKKENYIPSGIQSGNEKSLQLHLSSRKIEPNHMRNAFT